MDQPPAARFLQLAVGRWATGGSGPGFIEGGLQNAGRTRRVRHGPSARDGVGLSLDLWSIDCGVRGTNLERVAARRPPRATMHVPARLQRRPPGDVRARVLRARESSFTLFDGRFDHRNRLTRRGLLDTRIPLAQSDGEWGRVRVTSMRFTKPGVFTRRYVPCLKNQAVVLKYSARLDRCRHPNGEPSLRRVPALRPYNIR
jgi:hypothetical protein